MILRNVNPASVGTFPFLSFRDTNKEMRKGGNGRQGMNMRREEDRKIREEGKGSKEGKYIPEILKELKGETENKVK